MILVYFCSVISYNETVHDYYMSVLLNYLNLTGSGQLSSEGVG